MGNKYGNARWSVEDCSPIRGMSHFKRQFRILSEYCRSPKRNMKPEPPEREAGVPPTRPRYTACQTVHCLPSRDPLCVIIRICRNVLKHTRSYLQVACTMICLPADNVQRTARHSMCHKQVHRLTAAATQAPSLKYDYSCVYIVKFSLASGIRP
jgi:hypothetical protein